MKNLVGKNFNRWSVIKFMGKNDNYQKIYLCQCNCGKYKNVLGYTLINNKSKSCGCLNDELLIKRQTSKLNTKLNKNQQAIFDGLMLSDAYLILRTTNPYFNLKSITKSFIQKTKKLIPLQWRKLQILRAGFYNHKNCKQTYTLTSKTDTGLLQEYYRWYKNKIKIVPYDITISPLLLKYWFYGDGSTTFDKTKPNIVYLRLHTNGFTYQECKLLQNKLYKVGLKFNIHKSGAVVNKNNRNTGYFLEINKIKHIREFFKYIGNCDVSGFLYKWKIPYFKNKVII